MNIIVDLNYPIKDGTEVVFRSPVDCSQVTGLLVNYQDNGNCSKEFAFADAHGNNVGDIDHLFAENVAVKVILDVTTGMAFVQNADTNAYLEGRFKELEDKIGTISIPAVLFTEQDLTPEQQAQARDNIGAVSLNEVPLVGPRAQLRDASIMVEGEKVRFADVYVAPRTGSDNVAYQYYGMVFALEERKSGMTSQRVFRSTDGGNTWSVYTTLPMDTDNGVWFTHIIVDSDGNGTREIVYGVKTTDGLSGQNNILYVRAKRTSNDSWYKPSELSLGAKTWLTNDSGELYTYNKKRYMIFGEYGSKADGSTYSLYRTTAFGAEWTKVLEMQGDVTTGSGEIRHWHTVKVDPYTNHLWAGAGDTDRQCQIYRSTDGGDTWELMFSGSQRERTCSFAFEEDCIYYGMDATHTTDINFTKLIKIDKSKLDTDRENCREDVAIIDRCCHVRGLTRTFFPEGLLVYTEQEPSNVFKSDTLKLQFYDYAAKRLYTVATFDISKMDENQPIGFMTGAKYQLFSTGAIYATPTAPLHFSKYPAMVSRAVKLGLTL